MPVKANLSILPERVLRLPSLPRLANKCHRRLPEADPAAHPSHESAPFREAPQRLDSSPTHQAKISRVQRNIRGGHATQQSIKQRRRSPLEQTFAAATFPHGDDDIESLPPLLDEAWNDLRGVLQIGIHHHHRRSGSVVKTGGNGNLMTEVPGEADILHSLVLGAQFAQ